MSVVTQMLLPNDRDLLIEPYFEVLKVILYTASGYLFAKLTE